MHSVHTVVRFMLILSSRQRLSLPRSLFPFRVRKNVARVSVLSHECYMHCSSHPLFFLSFPSTCISRLQLQNSPQYFVILGLCTCLSVSLLFGGSCIKCAWTGQSLGMVTTPTQVYKRMMYHVHSVPATCFDQYCGHPQEGAFQRMCHKMFEPVHKSKILNPLCSHFSVITNTELFLLYFVGSLVGSCTPLPPTHNSRPLKSRQI